jgi:hypothetical protein
MLTKKSLGLFLTLVLFSIKAEAQIQSGTVTSAGADCSVAARCSVYPIARNSQTITVDISGSFTGLTGQFEFSAGADVDANYKAIPMNNVVSQTTGVTSATNTGYFTTPNYNFSYVRFRASALSSGSVTVSWNQGFQSAATGTSSPSGGNSNLTQLGGNAIALGAGNVDSGTQRTTYAANGATIPTKCVDSGGGDCTDATLHAQKVSVVGSSIAGATPVIKSALSTTVFTLASGVAILDSVICYNPHATADAYVQFFNTTSSVTLGTTVPDYFIPCPHSSNCGGMNTNINFGTGIKLAATTTSTGSSAPTTALECSFGKR